MILWREGVPPSNAPEGRASAYGMTRLGGAFGGRDALPPEEPGFCKPRVTPEAAQENPQPAPEPAPRFAATLRGAGPPRPPCHGFDA